MTKLTKKQAREDSIARALDHHQERGIVRSWDLHFVDRREWVVDLYMVGWKTYSTGEAEALCAGLAAAAGREIAAGLGVGVLDLDWGNLARAISDRFGERLMGFAGELEVPEEDLIIDAISEAITRREDST
jgi:hypothetical protein